MQLSRNSKVSFAAFVVFDLLLAYWLITLFQARDEVETINALNAPVSYTHLRAHETVLDLVCRLLLEKKK